ncbi:U32 family peptidase, partial [Oleispira antarctica]
MQFSIGNILFYWPKDRVTEFYEQAKTSTAEHVYLGESVCSKRRELTLKDYLQIGQSLQQSGKKVVLTSLALLEAKSELASLKKVCDNGHFLVEANDFGAVELLIQAGIPFVAGAALNIYNQYDLQVLVNKGMKRWVMPVELSKDWLTQILAGCEALGIRDKFEVELYGYGFLPLAYSARCFTARSEDKPKDQCQ